MRNHSYPPTHSPVAFDESLVIRCFPYKFRRIGHPFDYLDGIGIDAVVEFIAKGYLLIDVAECVDLPLQTLRRWVEERNHFSAVSDAETLSAEGFLALARKMVADARDAFQLSKGKELLRHAQYMAEKKNKPIYGPPSQANAPTGGVSYVFNIGAQSQAPIASKVIEAEVVKEVQGRSGGAGAQSLGRIAMEPAPNGRATVRLGDLFAYKDLTERLPHHLSTPTEAMPELFNDPRTRAPAAPPAPNVVDVYAIVSPDDADVASHLIKVADRPTTPTPEAPDVGPFYEDITAATAHVTIADPTDDK